jgi:hypothetical protein
MRLLMLGVASFALACARRPIGALTAEDHARAGRPLEARAALAVAEPSPWTPLDEATLLHAAGRYRESEAAFARAGALPVHAVEALALRRLSALNRAAAQQSLEPLAEVFPALGLEALGPQQAAVLVIIERGWAPIPFVGQGSNGVRSEGLFPQPPAPRVTVRLDALPPQEPALLADETRAWGEATLERLRANDARAQGFGLDLSARLAAAFEARALWWTAPTQWLITELRTSPGAHVVLLPEGNTFRERQLDLAPGQRQLLVVRP